MLHFINYFSIVHLHILWHSEIIRKSLRLNFSFHLDYKVSIIIDIWFVYNVINFLFSFAFLINSLSSEIYSQKYFEISFQNKIPFCLWLLHVFFFSVEIIFNFNDFSIMIWLNFFLHFAFYDFYFTTYFNFTFQIEYLHFCI